MTIFQLYETMFIERRMALKKRANKRTALERAAIRFWRENRQKLEERMDETSILETKQDVEVKQQVVKGPAKTPPKGRKTPKRKMVKKTLSMAARLLLQAKQLAKATFAVARRLTERKYSANFVMGIFVPMNGKTVRRVANGVAEKVSGLLNELATCKKDADRIRIFNDIRTLAGAILRLRSHTLKVEDVKQLLK